MENKTVKKFLLVFLLAITSFLVYYKTVDPVSISWINQAKTHSESTQEKVSHYLGYIIWKHYLHEHFDYSLDKVIEGMRAAERGEPSPITDDQFDSALEQLHSQLIEQNKQNNLKEAEAYLISFAKKPGVREVLPGKLYYLVIQKGLGRPLKETDSPAMYYTIHYPREGDLKELYSINDQGDPITVSLADAIPGFIKGVLGMQEGEKRLVVVHPDLAYGDTGRLEANLLLVFEVELIALASEK